MTRRVTLKTCCLLPDPDFAGSWLQALLHLDCRPAGKGGWHCVSGDPPVQVTRWATTAGWGRVTWRPTWAPTPSSAAPVCPRV